MWHLFRISVSPEMGDVVSGFLPALGSTGVIDETNVLMAYFPAGDRTRKQIEGAIITMLSNLADAGIDVSGMSFTYESVPDQDWNEAWKGQIHPLRLHCGVTIIPPWLEPVMSEQGTLLIIDPGAAFGSGHHETTADCLCAIRDYAAEARSESFVMADLGTGTGALAILGALSGFRSVMAIDHDPRAVDAARHNVALNALSHSIRVVQGSANCIPEGCGLIVANLFSGVLMDLMEPIAGALCQNGIFIGSGMLEGQEPNVIESMRKYGIRLRETICRERWVTVVGSKA